MFRSSLLRQVSRASTTAIRPPTSAFAAASPCSTTTPLRLFTTTPSHKDKTPLDPTEQLTTAGEPGASEHEGRFILHGKQASVIQFGDDWPNERMKLRREMWRQNSLQSS
ncbi:hypothetical protein KC322_g12320, partial [Hortaea werneckii]